MANYHEEIINIGDQKIIVCVPCEEYANFLKSIKNHNNNLRQNSDHADLVSVTSLRPLVKRLTKKAISWKEFQGVYF